MDSLERISQEVKECRKCELWKNRKNPVPGEGPENARIMLIGEAPGLEEEMQGRPFVGDAGRFLDEILNVAGLKRKEIFIGNVVKCRPSGNRTPRINEIKACKNYLLRQMRIINPDLIVLLGNTALKALVDKKLMVSRVHGKKLFKKYFVMYHPAAVLYNPKLKEIMIKDARKLRKILTEPRNILNKDNF